MNKEKITESVEYKLKVIHYIDESVKSLRNGLEDLAERRRILVTELCDIRGECKQEYGDQKPNKITGKGICTICGDSDY